MAKADDDASTAAQRLQILAAGFHLTNDPTEKGRFAGEIRTLRKTLDADEPDAWLLLCEVRALVVKYCNESIEAAETRLLEFGAPRSFQKLSLVTTAVGPGMQGISPCHWGKEAGNLRIVVDWTNSTITYTRFEPRPGSLDEVLMELLPTSCRLDSIVIKLVRLRRSEVLAMLVGLVTRVASPISQTLPEPIAAPSSPLPGEPPKSKDGRPSIAHHYEAMCVVAERVAQDRKATMGTVVKSQTAFINAVIVAAKAFHEDAAYDMDAKGQCQHHCDACSAKSQRHLILRTNWRRMVVGHRLFHFPPKFPAKTSLAEAVVSWRPLAGFNGLCTLTPEARKLCCVSP